MSRFVNYLLRTGSCLAAVFLLAVPASAIPMFPPPLLYQVEATVNLVDDPDDLLGGYFGNGDQLVALLAYDPFSVMSDPFSGPFYGEPPFNQTEVKKEGQSIFLSESSDLFAFNDFDPPQDGPRLDRVEIHADSDPADFVPTVPSVIESITAAIDLADFDANVISSDFLPEELLLGDYEDARLTLSGLGGGFGGQAFTSFLVSANITSITQVPEPSTAAVAIAMSFGFALMRNRHGLLYAC